MCAGGGGDGSSGAGDDKYGERTRSINNPDGTPNTSTYNYADSHIGRWMGDNRSDQTIANDRAQTEALERGDETFKTASGRTVSTRNYSRDFVTPSRGGVLANMNQAPSIGLFSSAASLAPFPANIPARIVGGFIDDRLGTRVTLGSSGGN